MIRTLAYRTTAAAYLPVHAAAIATGNVRLVRVALGIIRLRMWLLGPVRR